MHKNTFNKSERLCSKKQIDELFKQGKAFNEGFIRVIHTANSSTENQILISVSKRKFKKAVSRNLVKRRIREAYRINKTIIGIDCGVNVCFLYTDTQLQDYKLIEDKIILSLQRLASIYGVSNESIVEGFN